MNYMSVKEAAAKWQISERRVHQYCKESRIPGLKRLGRAWAIPFDAEKPMDPRTKKETRRLSALVEAAEESRIGAVIAAAGKYGNEGGISPLIDSGGTSLIRRMVLIFQQAHISPIVIITGYQALEVEHHLSDYGVIFIRNEDYDHSDKLDSVKLGLRFLHEKCDKVFLASLRIPMFTPETLCKMGGVDSMITIPTYQQKNGHPILIDARVIPDILSYQGPDGMRGAMKVSGREAVFLNVEDEGVLLRAEDTSLIDRIAVEHNNHLLHPFIRISIEKDRAFFDRRAKLLLYLIRETHSVQNACKQMAISKGKAWDMIIQMERELGFTVVKRKQGGTRERKTELTPKGERFLQFYLDYEKAVKAYAAEQFEERFAEFIEEN